MDVRQWMCYGGEVINGRSKNENEKRRRLDMKKTFIFSGGGINCHFEIDVNAESLDEAMELISEKIPPDKNAFGVIDVDEKLLCVCCLLGKR